MTTRFPPRGTGTRPRRWGATIPVPPPPPPSDRGPPARLTAPVGRIQLEAPEDLLGPLVRGRHGPAAPRADGAGPGWPGCAGLGGKAAVTAAPQDPPPLPPHSLAPATARRNQPERPPAAPPPGPPHRPIILCRRLAGPPPGAGRTARLSNHMARPRARPPPSFKGGCAAVVKAYAPAEPDVAGGRELPQDKPLPAAPRRRCVSVSELPLQVRRHLQPASCFPRSCSLKVRINELVFLWISIIGRWFHELGHHATPHLMEGVVQLRICNHPDMHMTPHLAKVQDEIPARSSVCGSWEVRRVRQLLQQGLGAPITLCSGDMFWQLQVSEAWKETG
ncbi:basic proline-rich protein-like [Falco biarmicus]|uniref:basic proline-rich protein-like n=1 Tax=Falco biarmicus TaxID=345155 RepID=UPI0024BD1752|nr:basic proline-rich protein-like [Falco biarmicus]